MQGLVLQLTRVGFLLLLWLFIWSVLRILRTDIYAPTGAVMVRRGLALRGYAAAHPAAPTTWHASWSSPRAHSPAPASRWAASPCSSAAPTTPRWC